MPDLTTSAGSPEVRPWAPDGSRPHRRAGDDHGAGSAGHGCHSKRIDHCHFPSPPTRTSAASWASSPTPTLRPSTAMRRRA